MTYTPPIAIHPAWRRACPWLPAASRPGRIFVGPGIVLRTLIDGCMVVVTAPGMPRAGIAFDPANAGRPRRY